MAQEAAGTASRVTGDAQENRVTGSVAVLMADRAFVLGIGDGDEYSPVRNTLRSWFASSKGDRLRRP